MSTFTLYPSAYLSGMDATFYGEMPYTTTPDTIRQYLADANDNTFALRSSPPGYIVTQQVTFELPNPTIPADEFIARIEGFVRWSEGGSGGFVGAAPYLGATPPSSIPYVTTDGRSPATPLTSTPFVQNVAWSTVDADNCNLLWLEGSQEDLSLVRTHQVGARLKTIKRSTCTVVDKTTTIDATPVISVPVTSTLDWEAAEPVNSALRKVDVEMRIELGGTVPESGTLIATATDTFQLAGTGTTTRFLTATEPIPNGTYKVYARATRNRATGTALADQVGAWSAAGTLTVNVPLPATPSVSVIEDEYGDSVSVFVTPISTSGYTSPKIDVERSDDDRQTWTAVRAGRSIPGAFGLPSDVVDYELPRAGELTTNLATNPSFEASSGNVFVHTNIATNPNAVAAAGFLDNNSSINTSTRNVGVPAPHPQGITTAASSARTGATASPLSLSQFNIDSLGGSGSPARRVGAWFYSAVAGYRATIYALGQTPVYSALPAGAWTFVVSGVDIPAGEFALASVGRTDGSTAPLGELAYITGVTAFSDGMVPTESIWGGRAASGDFTYVWSGAANASSSVQRAPALASVIAGVSVLWQSQEWAANFGGRSLRVRSNFASPSSAYADLQSLVGLTPASGSGKTFTILLRVRTAAARSRAPSLGLLWRVGTGAYQLAQAVAQNVVGEELLRLTVSLPAGLSEVYLRAYSNVPRGEPDAWFDELLVVEGVYNGGYFDGSHPPEGSAYAAWAGGENASVSYSAPTTPPYYRARVTALFNDEAENPSAWSTPAPIGLVAEGWNLKAVEVPGLAFIEVPVIGEVIQEIEEDVGVFRPLDRRLPVVVAGELTGYDGSLEIRLTEQWQWATLKSLIEAQRVLLMQRPYGDQQYIRFVDKRSIGLWGTPTNPQRRVILKYVETGAP